MGIKCKVCESDKKDYIEQMILQGNSNVSISDTLKAMGIEISHASVDRHKDNHMKEHNETIKANAGEKGNRKYDRDDSKNAFAINASGIYEEIKQQALHSISYDELAETNMTVRLMLNRILNNQMAITIDLQEKYMKGETKYPNEQIRGLQIIQDMAQKFEEFARKNFHHYKTLMQSTSGIKQHIVELGKKAKQELNSIRPYEKGVLFSILSDGTIDMYINEYYPANPYSESEFNNECDYNYFKEGIKQGFNTAENMDVRLHGLLESLYKDYELLTDEELDKTILRYSTNKYDVSKEIKKYEKIIDDYEEKALNED